MSAPNRILFAGGCHVAGYAVGEDAAFPALVERRAAVETPVRVVAAGYLKLAHRRRVAAACRRAATDVLVLQFGHPELNRRLSDYLRVRLGIGRRAPEPDFSDSAPLSDPGSFVSSPSALWNGSKLLIDRCLGHPLVDFERFEMLWERLLAEIGGCRIPRTVLLSPFPCADPLVMYYRRRGGEVIEAVARRHGHDYVDLLDAVPSNAGSGFYADTFHLGVRGHEAVAAILAGHLVEVPV